MANVTYWSSTWVSAGGNDLLPGQAHDWIMSGFNYGDTVFVTAHPITGNPQADRVLAVENNRIEGNVSGRRLFYTVRNVGPDSVPAYIKGYTWVS
jgi:hypothetical protein